MVTPRPSLLRTLAILITTVCLSIFLASCGPAPRSHLTHTTGPGGVVIGDTRQAVEQRNPKWTIHQEACRGDICIVTYRDYHWSLAHGFLHPAEYHRITYHADVVTAWQSANNPEGKE